MTTTWTPPTFEPNLTTPIELYGVDRVPNASHPTERTISQSTESLNYDDDSYIQDLDEYQSTFNNLNDDDPNIAKPKKVQIETPIPEDEPPASFSLSPPIFEESRALGKCDTCLDMDSVDMHIVTENRNQEKKNNSMYSFLKNQRNTFSGISSPVFRSSKSNTMPEPRNIDDGEIGNNNDDPGLGNNDDNEWDGELESVIKKWNEHSQAYSWMHKYAAQIYSKRAKRISISVILFSLATAIYQTTVVNQEDTTSRTISLALTYALASMTSIIKVMNYEENSKKHKISSLKYQELGNCIEFELTLPRSERRDGKIWGKYIKDKLDALKREDVDISYAVSSRFKEIFSKDYPDFSIPPVANGIEEINIHSA